MISASSSVQKFISFVFEFNQKGVIIVEKNRKEISGVYTALGLGIGLLYGIISSNLAFGLIFGCGVGVVIDSIIYSNKKVN